MKYPILGVEPFGAALIGSGDLDPIYIALHGARLGRDQLRRWLVAYWCCYHAGASSWISEQTRDGFWGSMIDLAENSTPCPVGSRWPRGRERRHFRGVAAVSAVTQMRARYPDPEQLVVDLCAGSMLYADVAKRARTLPLFGPWIAFKVCDMLERVLGVRVDFTASEVFMFDQPKAAALAVASRSTWSLDATETEKVTIVAQDLCQTFSSFSAPPLYDRPCGLQEVETVLCKWKSHTSGRYPIGIDSVELRHALLPWTSVSATAAEMLQAAPMPPPGAEEPMLWQ